MTAIFVNCLITQQHSPAINYVNTTEQCKILSKDSWKLVNRILS